MMIEIPNLAGVATNDLIQTVGGGSYSAQYINWSRTMQMLRDHAPDWLPYAVCAQDGGLLHRAPVGGYLLIGFEYTTGYKTNPIPQAVMDNRNAAIPYEKITARDITDTHRRGVCMAAAMTFGLAYELWAKMPLESGFAGEPEPVAPAGDPALCKLILDRVAVAESLPELKSVCSEGVKYSKDEQAQIHAAFAAKKKELAV